MQAALKSAIESSFAAAFRDPFRGQIHEYAAGLDLQGGYAVRGRFDVLGCRHLLRPLEALRDPRVRLVSIQGAVQTTKSLLADLVVPYWIEHDPGDTLWLFEDDAKAKQYADTRAMQLIRSKPEIAAMLQDVDRNDKAKTWFRLHHMNLLFAGLNEGNVQSLSWRYVIVDEPWIHRADGLLRQAIYRTTQYADNCKVLVISQGGYEDEDQDAVHRETDCRVLEWACPGCGFRQPFELSRLRGDDHPEPRLRGTYSGLSWDTNEATRPGGRWDWEAVGRTAHHRCWRCDARIEDTPEVRRRLNDSYDFRPTSLSAESGKVGFWWPAEASMRIPFSRLVVRYLRAKVALDELSYALPMQEFTMKDRGLTWSDASKADFRPVIQEAYDIRSDWAQEAHRFLIADVQKDLAKFHAGVFAVSGSGESRELARETLASFDEIARLQSQWEVKDQCTFLDCGYRMTDVLRECVRRGHAGQVKVRGKLKQIWLCWTGLKGSGQEVFLWTDPRTKLKEWRIHSARKWYNVSEGTSLRLPRAPWYEFSDLHCKDLVRARRDAESGAPKFLTLPDSLPGTDPWSHFAQMRSEKRIERFANGRRRAIWVPLNPKSPRPNHEWDKAAMLMAVEAIAGIIGRPDEAASEDPQRAAG